jgi:Adenosine deaminase
VDSLLHLHFESALRALAVARPRQLEHMRSVYESPAYAAATPAGRLSLLDRQVARLGQGQDIFSREVFTEVIRRLCEEMTSSGVGHVDLRVGVLTRRWPWLGGPADLIEAFRGELAVHGALTVSFLGAVNLSKPHDMLDAVFGAILEDTRTAGLLAGLDINMLPADLATLDRYLASLRDLQRSGLRINIHLGELFGPGFSHRVLSRITPSRIGHGVLLLDDPEAVQLIRAHGICLDMCPVSNTRLGVWDWARSSPAAKAMRLGLPVTISTDDPVLFGAGLADNLALAGLSPNQLDAARLAGSRYGYRDDRQDDPARALRDRVRRKINHSPAIRQRE